MAKVRIHTTFVHDCSDWPEGFDAHNRFVEGELVNVPDDMADYFKRAGWAADDGEEPVKPDPTKPVLVKPSAHHDGRRLH